jgi:putative ABC transport system permease protein
VADSNTLIINNAMAAEAGWDDPLGKFIYMSDERGEKALEVIGVVENFHFASLHERVMPLLIMHDPRNFRYISIKTENTAMQPVLDRVEEIWDALYPQMPFQYFIQDNRLDQLYRAEMNMGRLFFYFSLVALVIASLGILAMVLFKSRLRIREIAIRKVFGSASIQIMQSYLKEYLIWIALACLVAWPASWLFARNWLKNFNDQTTIPIWVFLASGLLAFIICTVTTGYQTYRTARTNPARSLRYE